MRGRLALALVAFATCGLVAGATRLAPAKHDDGASDRVFFFNSVTGESRNERPPEMPIPTDDGHRYWVVDGEAVWTPPEKWAWIEREAPDGTAFFENSVSGETQWERPEAAAWTARSSNRFFFYNRKTKETTRERPPVLGHHSEEHDATYYVDESGTATWDAPEKAAWTKHHSEEHSREFYSNSKTKESGWDFPDDSNLAWVKWHEEHHEEPRHRHAAL